MMWCMKKPAEAYATAGFMLEKREIYIKSAR